MANYHVIRTARLTDRQVLDLIDVFKHKMILSSASVTLGPGVQVDIAAENTDGKQMEGLYRDRHAIQQSLIVIEDLSSVYFYRGIATNVDRPFSDRQASPYFDEVILNMGDRRRVPGMRNQVIECMDIIEEALPEVFPLQDVDKVHGAVDVLQAQMAGLADQYKEMLRDLAEERAEFRKEHEERRQSLEQEREADKKQVKEEARHRKVEFDLYQHEELEKLKQREDEVEKREKDLDDRQHMHARRELRQQITEGFKRRLGEPVVSGRTSTIRWAVFGLTIIAGLGIGYVGIENFQDLISVKDKNELPTWVLVGWVLRGTVSLFLAVGFIVYAINWLRIVYLDDVRTARRYESYGNDIDRASFVIETIMEVGEKEQASVPDAWVEGVCRNLFTDKSESGYGKVPPNVAAMLFESIGGAKFGPEGAEVTMRRRDARRFAKKLEGQE